MAYKAGAFCPFLRRPRRKCTRLESLARKSFSNHVSSIVFRTRFSVAGAPGRGSSVGRMRALLHLLAPTLLFLQGCTDGPEVRKKRATHDPERDLPEKKRKKETNPRPAGTPTTRRSAARRTAPGRGTGRPARRRSATHRRRTAGTSTTATGKKKIDRASSASAPAPRATATSWWRTGGTRTRLDMCLPIRKLQASSSAQGW